LFDIFVKKPIKSSYVREKAGQGTDISVCALSGCHFSEGLALPVNTGDCSRCRWGSQGQCSIGAAWCSAGAAWYFEGCCTDGI